MPATGGGRAPHAPSAKMPPPRRESSAAVPAQRQRPGIKTRAYSAPSVPKNDSDAPAHVARTDDDNEGEEIADDAFFQRYHFPQPMPVAHEEDAPSSPESSSDTEGPLSPTHVKDRHHARDSISAQSTGVSLAIAPPPQTPTPAPRPRPRPRQTNKQSTSSSTSRRRTRTRRTRQADVLPV